MNRPFPKRVLVVDDDRQSRTMLDLVLAGEGHHVTHAAVGWEALQLHQKHSFDLVLVELLLASNDGFDTFVKLHSTAAAPKIIAIAKPSRMEANAYLKIARQLGADDTLAKPFTTDQVLMSIRRLIGDQG